MDQVTEAGAAQKGKGKGKGKKKAGGQSGAQSEGQIARLLVRAIWQQEWSAANPSGKAEDRKAAWMAAREAALEKNLKPYRRALNVLSRGGVTMSLSEVPPGDTDGAAED